MSAPKGNKFATGGKREGAGRKPDEFNIAVQQIGDPLKVIQFYYETSQNKKAEMRDRLKAAELYLARRVGNVPQSLEHTGAGGSRLIFNFPPVSK